MKTNTTFLINELETNAQVFQHLMKVSSADQVTWKPDENKWCLLEIVCHLVDEEVLDFRTRVNTALHPDDYSFVPIDPVGWVNAKSYISQDYAHKVDQWLSEREESIHWLKSLESPNWESVLVHPELGKMSAGQFLENWVAHDFIHLRQMTRTKRAYLNHMAQKDIGYAGKW